MTFGTGQLGDIPGPDLIRARRDQLGGGIGRMNFVGRSLSPDTSCAGSRGSDGMIEGSSTTQRPRRWRPRARRRRRGPPVSTPRRCDKRRRLTWRQIPSVSPTAQFFFGATSSRRFSASSWSPAGRRGAALDPGGARASPAGRPPHAAAASSSGATSTTPRDATGRPPRRASCTRLRMRSRYAAEKRRRCTVAGTSGSGARAGNVVAGSRPPVALRAPSTPDPATTSISTASGMRVISPTSPAPTLNSTGRLSHRLLAQGGRRTWSLLPTMIPQVGTYRRWAPWGSINTPFYRIQFRSV